MKKFILTIALAIMALTMSRCTMVYGEPQFDTEYGNEEQYNQEDYAYLDNYTQVDWSQAQYDMEYSYYDMDRVFLVVYGGRIFVIPYDYFWHYIYPHFRMRIIFRSYDYFCGMWGWDYYNNLWGYWNYRHNHPYWRPHFDYYEHHRNRNYNRPFVIRKNELQQRYNDTHYQVKPQPRNFVPRHEGLRNYNYVPRNERHFVPRGEYPRSFNNQQSVRHQIPEISRHFTPPPPVKQDNGEHKH